MGAAIDDPLCGLMLSTHSCVPDCGCDGDFEITPEAIRPWIGEFGETLAREAMAQLEGLIARGSEIAHDVAIQRNQHFSAPPDATEWLREWRRAIAQALATAV